MKKIIILIPVFNDWESLKKLLSEINENIKSFSEINFECLKQVFRNNIDFFSNKVLIS